MDALLLIKGFGVEIALVLCMFLIWKEFIRINSNRYSNMEKVISDLTKSHSELEKEIIALQKQVKESNESLIKLINEKNDQSDSNNEVVEIVKDLVQDRVLNPVQNKSIITVSDFIKMNTDVYLWNIDGTCYITYNIPINIRLKHVSHWEREGKDVIRINTMVEKVRHADDRFEVPAEEAVNIEKQLHDYIHDIHKKPEPQYTLYPISRVLCEGCLDRGTMCDECVKNSIIKYGNTV